MNRYFTLLAAVIVTSSLGNPKIHAKNCDNGQTFVPYTETFPETFLPLPADNHETITMSPVTGTSILAPISGTAVRIAPLSSISGTAITTENLMPNIDMQNIQPKNTSVRYIKKESSQKKSMKNNAKKIKYTKMEVPKHNNFKSYMGYQSITCRTSKQYKLQQKAKTGKFGIRTVEGRYLIAMGTYYTKNVGDKFDIKLSDGTVIKCMIGDIKSDKHTDAKKQKQKYDGSIIEFITDPAKMPSTVKRAGSYSVCKKFSGSVKEIRKLK